VARAIITLEPGILGLSLTCWDIDAQLVLAREVKAAQPTVRIVAGGPSASARGEKLLLDCPAIDAVIAGEGEVPFAHLVERVTGGTWDLTGTCGISWRAPSSVDTMDGDAGTIIAGKGHGERLPFDRLRSVLSAGVYRPSGIVNLEFARGCRRQCRFCAWRRHGGGMRTASLERIRGDITLALNHPVHTACILDSAVNTDERHFERIACAVAEADPNRRLGLRGFIDLHALADRQLELIRDMRIDGAEVGLNSVNPAALLDSGREPVDTQQFERRLDQLAALCPVDLHLMLGLPGDDLSGLRKTLEYTVRQMDRIGRERLPVVTVFWMVVEQGSYYHKNRERLGLVIQEPGMPYVLSTARMSREDLVLGARMFREHRLADRFQLDGPRQLLDGILDSPPVQGGYSGQG
jgi:hypothetical protein